jgi:hypothetical protein
VFAGQPKQIFKLLELHVRQLELQALQLLFEFPEGLTVLLRQERQLPLLKYVLVEQVAQGPVEVQLTHVDGHTMQEVLVLPAGFTEFPEQAGQVPEFKIQ